MGTCTGTGGGPGSSCRCRRCRGSQTRCGKSRCTRLHNVPTGNSLSGEETGILQSIFHVCVLPSLSHTTHHLPPPPSKYYGTETKDSPSVTPDDVSFRSVSVSFRPSRCPRKPCHLRRYSSRSTRPLHPFRPSHTDLVSGRRQVVGTFRTRDVRWETGRVPKVRTSSKVYS